MLKKQKIFLEELSNPYDTIITDKNGTIAVEWGAYGVPETFLIYNRKIVKKIKNENELKIICFQKVIDIST